MVVVVVVLLLVMEEGGMAVLVVVHRPIIVDHLLDIIMVDPLLIVVIEGIIVKDPGREIDRMGDGNVIVVGPRIPIRLIGDTKVAAVAVDVITVVVVEEEIVGIGETLSRM